MAQVDVTELLRDPDFIDEIFIIRRQPIINEFGENKLKEHRVLTYGSVQPASGKTLQRLPDQFRVANVLSFFVKGEIVSDGQSEYPDVLVFNGSRFAVQVIFDWTNWGEGWCEGTCVREKPTL